MSRPFSILVVAVLLLAGFTASLQVKAADATPLGEIPAPFFLVYPDSATSFNPRVPCIAPVDKTGGGKCLEAEAVFQYALAPWLTFGQGGTLHAQVRDNGRREAKEVMALADGTVRLVLRIDKASAGGLPALVLVKDGKDQVSASFAKPLPKQWTGLDLVWNREGASLTLENGDTVKIAFPHLLAPESISLQTAQVADVKVEGDGTFSLDWEDGYAARVRPSTGSSAVGARFFGFDTYVISQDNTKRDCPMVQVINGGNGEQTVTFDYEMTGEVSGSKQHWSQELKVPAQSGIMAPLTFPGPLASDVYHLSIHSASLSPVYDATRNFLFVESRDELAGPPKFGFHDSARNLFGCWPDALPVRLSTNYISWGVVVGPAWLKDPGMTADTPADEWNWNRRIDWAIGQGLTPYVSIDSTPFYDWARERNYPDKMKKQGWGFSGGFPRLDLYRQFVKTIALRYQGKVHFYEVENEPMAGRGIPPEDYVKIAQAASEEIHSVDPTARVYGICGTGDFIPWMQKVFELGGAQVMDGVSVHTYVTPNTPENANLPAKLAEADKIIAGAGRPMPLLNSETGTYVALREEVDHAIAPDRLAELIKAGAPNLAVKSGWPFHAIDERSGGISVVRNAIYNFLAKAEYFTFFGYNPAWPPANWATGASLFSGEHGVDDACWAMISAAKNGERTPSLFTLSVGVLTEQMQGAQQLQGKAVNGEGLMGGVFPKANGGEVAVLWSPLGKRSALIEAPDSEIERISMFGQKAVLTPTGNAGNGVFRLELDEEPVYLHLKQPGFHLLPSPVIALASEVSGTPSGFHFTVVNTYQKPWTGSVLLAPPSGWKVALDAQDFSLDPGGKVVIKGNCEIPTGIRKGSYTIEASLKLPDGTPFTFPVQVNVRPTLLVPHVAETFVWDQTASWQQVQSLSKIDQTEQVVVGRPPTLASLQEEKYWKGPGELSADIRVASNAGAFYVYAEVQDANLKVPQTWPGVLGSCVELFLDARSMDGGLGRSAYGPGVHQLVLKPAIDGQEAVQIWDASEKMGKLDGVHAVGGLLSPGKYWMAIQIPWSALGRQETQGLPLGFDLGINGPPQNGVGRKSQLMLFGTGANNLDASNFGMATLATDAAKVEAK